MECCIATAVGRGIAASVMTAVEKTAVEVPAVKVTAVEVTAVERFIDRAVELTALGGDGGRELHTKDGGVIAVDMAV